MRRRIVIISGWFFATLMALCLSMIAVGMVGSRVNGVTVHPLSRQDAIDELGAGLGGAVTRDGSTPGGAIASAATSTAPDGSAAVGTGDGSGSSAPPGGASGPGSATAPSGAAPGSGSTASGGTTSSPGGSGSSPTPAPSGATPTTIPTGGGVPVTTPPTTVPRSTATFSDGNGNQVLISCVDSTATATATPALLWQVDAGISMLTGSAIDARYSLVLGLTKSSITATCAKGVITRT